VVSPGLHPDRPAAGPVIRSYSSAGFAVDGDIFQGVLLTPERAAEWRPPPIAELFPESVEALLGLDPAPEFLILGTGPAQAFPPRRFVEALAARGIGVEAMDSRAAARTWGVLRAEQRWIVAAIMPI
jgi:uncharacterized protein